MPEPSEEDIFEPQKKKEKESFGAALKNLVKDTYNAKAFLTEI